MKVWGFARPQGHVTATFYPVCLAAAVLHLVPVFGCHHHPLGRRSFFALVVKRFFWGFFCNTQTNPGQLSQREAGFSTTPPSPSALKHVQHLLTFCFFSDFQHFFLFRLCPHFALGNNPTHGGFRGMWSLLCRLFSSAGGIRVGLHSSPCWTSRGTSADGGISPSRLPRSISPALFYSEISTVGRRQSSENQQIRLWRYFSYLNKWCQTSNPLTTFPKKALTAPLPWHRMEGLTVGLCSFMKSMKAFRGFFM